VVSRFTNHFRNAVSTTQSQRRLYHPWT